MKHVKQKRLLLAATAVCLAILLLYLNNQFYAKCVLSAVEKEDVETVRFLVQLPIGNLNSKPDLWITEVIGEHAEYTPLQAACRIGNPEIVQLLLDGGADVNYVYWDEIRGLGSPLINAAGSMSDNRLDILKILVEHGADLDYVTVDGEDALSCAVYASFDRADAIAVIEYLESSGMRIDKQYAGSGETLLHKACMKGNSKLIRYLIEEKGLDVNVLNSCGETPLTYYLRFCNEKTGDGSVS